LLRLRRSLRTCSLCTASNSCRLCSPPRQHTRRRDSANQGGTKSRGWPTDFSCERVGSLRYPLKQLREFVVYFSFFPIPGQIVVEFDRSELVGQPVFDAILCDFDRLPKAGVMRQKRCPPTNHVSKKLPLLGVYQNRGTGFFVTLGAQCGDLGLDFILPSQLCRILARIV